MNSIAPVSPILSISPVTQTVFNVPAKQQPVTQPVTQDTAQASQPVNNIVINEYNKINFNKNGAETINILNSINIDSAGTNNITVNEYNDINTVADNSASTKISPGVDSNGNITLNATNASDSTKTQILKALYDALVKADPTTLSANDQNTLLQTIQNILGQKPTTQTTGQNLNIVA